MTHKNRKQFEIFLICSAGLSLLMAEGFFSHVHVAWTSFMEASGYFLFYLKIGLDPVLSIDLKSWIRACY